MLGQIKCIGFVRNDYFGVVFIMVNKHRQGFLYGIEPGCFFSIIGKDQKGNIEAITSVVVGSIPVQYIVHIIPLQISIQEPFIYVVGLGIGFVTAFFSALIVVHWLIRFVSNHTFLVFAYYRIAFGTILLGWLLFRQIWQKFSTPQGKY